MHARRPRRLRASGHVHGVVLGLSQTDVTGGFKCFRARALRTLDPGLVRSRGYAFQIELTYQAARAGMEIAEIPIVFHERRHGHSKMSPQIALEALWKVPLMRLAAPRPHPAGVLGLSNR